MRSTQPSPVGEELLFAEELLARQGIPTAFGSYTMTEPSIREFAQSWDPLPMHIGDGGHFGTVIASGLHTLAVFQRLAVESAYRSWAVVAGRGIRDLVLPRPVFPGDQLSGWVQVNGGVQTRPEMVKLDIEGHLENQDGKQVLHLRLDNYVRSRGDLNLPTR